MANKHIKTINGRKYYYKSIRIGNKVTSQYLGPVEAVKKTSPMEKTEKKVNTTDETKPDDLILPDESYIG